MGKTIGRGVVVAVAVLGFAGAASAQGDPARGEKRSVTCATCHGPDGNSSVPEWPTLAGLDEAYIVRQLSAYQAGTRQDPLMTAMAKPLSDQDKQDLAAFYASQKVLAGPAGPPAAGGAVSPGKWIYENGLHASRVTACKACHAAAGTGHAAAGFPRLGGQHAAYTAATLRAFRAGERTSDAEGMMREIAGRMSDDDITAVAAYIAGLAP